MILPQSSPVLDGTILEARQAATETGSVLDQVTTDNISGAIKNITGVATSLLGKDEDTDGTSAPVSATSEAKNDWTTNITAGVCAAVGGLLLLMVVVWIIVHRRKRSREAAKQAAKDPNYSSGEACAPVLHGQPDYFGNDLNNTLKQ